MAQDVEANWRLDLAFGARLSHRPRLLRFLRNDAAVMAKHQFTPTAACIMMPETAGALEAASAGNIGALLSVRDPGDNAMAKVHAAKALETMLDTVSEHTGIGRAVQQQRQPGLRDRYRAGRWHEGGRLRPSRRR
jgi:hypothetical protein